MSDIYKNSFLTLAAASASNSQAGFLSSRTKHLGTALPAFPRAPLGLKIREAIDRKRPVQEPLEARAWAFQERLIPNRILFFGSREMRWECNSSTLTESGHKHSYDVTSGVISRELYHSTLSTVNVMEASTSETNPENGDSSSLYALWRASIVPAYAKLSLTKESDRLVALSAIATEVQLRTKDVYLAGLWKRDLLLGLLWRSSSGKVVPEPGRLQTKYLAPSWSWASIETASLFAETRAIVAFDKKYAAKILDAQCELAGINPTGNVNSGFIKLSCHWLPATLLIEELQASATSSEQSLKYSFDGLPTYSNDLTTLFWPDVPLIEGLDVTISGGGGLAKTVKRSPFTPGQSRPAVSAPVSCILLARLPSGHVVFVVLGRSEKQAGAFERLGLLKIRHLFLRPGWKEQLNLSEFAVV